jgi:hypothetical protein
MHQVEAVIPLTGLRKVARHEAERTLAMSMPSCLRRRSSAILCSVQCTVLS